MNESNKTKTEYIERLNEVISYIQSNVDEKLSLNKLAEIANFSPFYFHRIFTAYIGESVNSYIKRIKLDNSALKLKYTNEHIVDIAFSCGYETASAYAKAFKQLFKLTPSEFRVKNNTNKHWKSEEEYRGYLKNLSVKTFSGIKVLPDMQVLFVQKNGNYREVFNEAWSVLLGFAEANALINEGTKFIAICLDDPEITPAEKLRYFACISVDREVNISGEIGIKVIQGGKYAAFLHEGSYETLYQTYDAMLLGWLPDNYEKFEKNYNILRDVPCFEILNRDFLNTKPEDLRTEIYLPVN